MPPLKLEWSVNMTTLLSVAFTGGIIYAKVSSIAEAHNALEIKLEQMDQRGTRWSHEGIVSDQQQLKDTQSRLALLEASNNIIGPLLARLDERTRSMARAQGIKDDGK